ncbi:MAG: NUDIX hydrolase [Candidatus Ratteibacteria bacterium]|jgi:ADP-ribose pyrophosphatase YjhB (NUDIX family)
MNFKHLFFPWQIFKRTLGGRLGYIRRKLGHYPIPTVDIIIEMENSRVILIKRKNPPYGWAIPGGFVEWGESLEEAAVREAKEETSLGVSGLCQLHTYSVPNRDPRFHTISTVFAARADGQPKAEDDAIEIGIFGEKELPDEIVFDHREILADYFFAKHKL